MGRARRSRPKMLGAKLLLIRNHFGLTQPKLIEQLNVKGEKLYPSNISLYETGKREPSLPVLLAYARLAGLSMDALVDDKLKLRHKDFPD